MRARFAQEWQGLQERFVDQPSDAVVGADRLVYNVMETRGYPMGNFDAQADLVSVDHPEVVENYRFAHGIRERVQAQQASTEDLREALLRLVRFDRCDLTEADLTLVRVDRCELRGCTLDGLAGLERLRGAAMPWPDIVGHAGLFAAALGIRVLDADDG